jgi:hypothetical protein
MLIFLPIMNGSDAKIIRTGIPFRIRSQKLIKICKTDSLFASLYYYGIFTRFAALLISHNIKIEAIRLTNVYRHKGPTAQAEKRSLCPKNIRILQETREFNKCCPGTDCARYLQHRCTYRDTVPLKFPTLVFKIRRLVSNSWGK